MIDVVLPCLDEAAALPWVLPRMPDGYRAVVVDNGSTDGSAEIAAGHGAHVVHEPRRGFGAACHAGLLAATSGIVCFMDADASLDPADLPRVVDLLAGTDLALGRRRPVTRGAARMSSQRGAGTRPRARANGDCAGRRRGCPACEPRTSPCPLLRVGTVWNPRPPGGGGRQVEEEVLILI